MAKTTTKTGTKTSAAKRGGGGAAKKGNRKPKSAPRKNAAKVPARARTASSGGSRSSGAGSSSTSENVVDALVRLLESPLVADLLAVGATAALSAVTASRFSRRDGENARSSNALKAAGKAAAAAMGRRLSEEIDAIREAAKSANDAAA